MYVVLLGAPGAGKGTQAPLLARALGVVHVATGDMLREAVRQRTAYGERARAYMQEGKLVPDEIVLALTLERLDRPDARRGFVLDGFPRTLVQAEALDRALEAAGKRLDRALWLEVPHDVLVARLSGRWICASCQTVYHELTSPPSVPGVCDRCGGDLRQRADDRPEAVERRLRVYLAETAPLVEYYRARSVLRVVDGNQPVDAVKAALLRAVQNGQRKGAL